MQSTLHGHEVGMIVLDGGSIRHRSAELIAPGCKRKAIDHSQAAFHNLSVQLLHLRMSLCVMSHFAQAKQNCINNLPNRNQLRQKYAIYSVVATNSTDSGCFRGMTFTTIGINSQELATLSRAQQTISNNSHSNATYGLLCCTTCTDGEQSAVVSMKTWRLRRKDARM